MKIEVPDAGVPASAPMRLPGGRFVEMDEPTFIPKYRRRQRFPVKRVGLGVNVRVLLPVSPDEYVGHDQVGRRMTEHGRLGITKALARDDFIHGLSRETPRRSRGARETAGRIGSSEIKHKRIVLAVDVPIVLPQFEDASTVRPRAKECSRGRNRFGLVGCKKSGAPNDLAVPVEQVTTVFERPRCPQR